MGLVLIFLLGIVGIIIGKKHIDRQQIEIAEVETHQKEHFKRQVDLHNEDLGLLLYYAKFAHINTLNPLAGLSIGQSDVNPTVKQITIKTFEAQRFDTDLINPMSLQSGNLDLSFVIIYLFPLLVTVLGFNIISEEIETETWQLVAIQAKSKLGLIISKLVVRFLLLFIVLFLLFLIAMLVMHISINLHFIAMFTLAVLYIIFWFVLTFLVICLKKASGFNALLLLSIWLVFLILLPAGINAYIAFKYPIPEALSTAIAQRDGYHTKWDTDKRATIKKFYNHYPQFKSYGYPTDGFNWLWYYAMQQMGDDDSKPQQNELNEKIELRENASTLISYAIPNMHLQLAFNRLAGTSTRQHMAYLNQTEAFHEELRLFFYPKVFNAEVEVKMLENLTPLFTAILLLLVMSIPLVRQL